MMVCCTQGALCSSSRRRRCDLPEPELPCTSRRVASSSSRSSAAAAPAVVCPISIATVMPRLKVSLWGGAYQSQRSASSADGQHSRQHWPQPNGAVGMMSCGLECQQLALTYVEVCCGAVHNAFVQSCGKGRQIY